MANAFLKGQIVAIPDEVISDVELMLNYIQGPYNFEENPLISDVAARVETFLRDIKEAALQDQDTTI